MKKESSALLVDPLLNKGTAFTEKERDHFGLHGFLPWQISTIEEQVQRRYANFSEQPSDLAKHIFLNALQNRNEILFYRLLYTHMKEMLPIVYTPTVGDVSLNYSLMYREHRGLYLSYPLKNQLQQILQKFPYDEIDVIVVTDGERILGLGDLGVGGMAISTGKLILYTLFGGIHPVRTLPIVLDVGTNNPHLLNDPLYLGWKHERIDGKEYDEFIDTFVRAVNARYPHALLQWEDFGKAHAGPLLEKYRHQLCSFNDDIQGTAAVVLAAILSAIKLLGTRLQDQKIAVLGAGSAGIGIVKQIVRAIVDQTKISEEEAMKHFYIVDRHGLVHEKVPGLDPNLQHFAQKLDRIKNWKVGDPSKINLLDVIENAQPTILIGVSTQAGAFTREIVESMARYQERPIIFPLSNPTSRSEAHPKDLLDWTHGKAIVATGSPFAPVTYRGESYNIAQCNNFYIFPGVGLGVIASKSREVSDKMFLKAAQILSQHSPILKDMHKGIFPDLLELRTITREIAVKVAETAISEGLSNVPLRDVQQLIDKNIWFPDYPVYAN